MKMKAVALFALIACGSAHAASEQVTVHQVTADGIGKSLGTGDRVWSEVHTGSERADAGHSWIPCPCQRQL